MTYPADHPHPSRSTPPPPNRLVRLGEAARIIGVPIERVRWLIDAGRLGGERIGAYRYTTTRAIAAFLDRVGRLDHTQGARVGERCARCGIVVMADEQGPFCRCSVGDG